MSKTFKSIDDFATTALDAQWQQDLERIVGFLSDVMSRTRQYLDSDVKQALSMLAQQTPEIIRELKELKTLEQEKWKAVEGYVHDYGQLVDKRQGELADLDAKYTQASESIQQSLRQKETLEADLKCIENKVTAAKSKLNTTNAEIEKRRSWFLNTKNSLTKQHEDQSEREKTLKAAEDGHFKVMGEYKDCNKKSRLVKAF